METKSRTEYSAMNTTVAVISRMTAILMGFVTRVIFTHTLSENYVGINGLFTDILNVLSLTELGAGTAITYALYRPIAEGNIKKQQQLMKLYQTFYRGTAVCVGVLGLALIPFMDVLMKNRPEVEHLTFIYLLYLANSVLSYLLVYKRTLIEAHQMNYVVLIYQTGFLVLQDLLQIVVLVTTGNFILFLLMYLMCTVLSNVCISRKAEKLFPYLKEKEKERLPAEERTGLFRNIRAMMMHKLGTVVVNNTDNLLISAFVGVVSVGIYSNYYLLIGSVRQVLDQVFAGITASVGNLGATEDQGKIREIFETAFFIGQWLYGFAAICLYELLNPFVELAFGRQYLFERSVVMILCINFFINGTRKAVLTFRDSMGLFWFDRYKALAEAALGHGGRAYDVYRRTCPAYIEDISEIHRTEPYVYSQMVAGRDAPTFGEAKNSWLTGTAAWTFVNVSQYILGIQPTLDGLRVDPCIPHTLAGYTVTRRYRGAVYHIRVENPHAVQKGVQSVTVNGAPIAGTLLPLAKAGESVEVSVILG